MKRWTKVLGFVLVMFLVLGLSGCGADGNASVNSVILPDETIGGLNSGVSDEGGIFEEPTGGSVCANQYMPVVNGANWTYSSSGGDVEPYFFTDMVTDASSRGFTLYSEFDGLKKEQTWECSGEGLIALEYTGGGGQASIATSGVKATFETTEMRGITLPNTITVGDDWSQTFTVRGESSLDGGMLSETSGTVQIHMTAIGIETVEVPSGSFEAIKLEVQTNIDFLISIDGGESLPFLMSSSGHTWIVEGIGWVKSVSTATVMGMTTTDTLELISYTIPE